MDPARKAIFLFLMSGLTLSTAKFDYLQPGAAVRMRLLHSNKFMDDQITDDIVLANQIGDDIMHSKQIVQSEQLGDDMIYTNEVSGDWMHSNEVRDDKVSDDRMRADKVRNDRLHPGQIRNDRISETVKEAEATVQDNEFIAGFIDSYVEEHELEISADLVFDVLQRLQKSSNLRFSGANLPPLFVQMGSLIDVLAALDKQTDDVDEIVEEQVHKIGSSTKSKDVLQILAGNLKSELVNLMLKGPMKKSPPPQKLQKQKSDPGMSDLLQLGSKLLKGGGAGQKSDPGMSDLLLLGSSLLKGGGVGHKSDPGMSDLLQLGSKLLKGGGAGQIASLLGGDGIKNIASLLGGGGVGQIASLLGGNGLGQVLALLGGDGEGQLGNFLKSGGAKKMVNFVGGDVSSLDSSKMDLLSKMVKDYASGTPWDALLKNFGGNLLSSEYGLHAITQNTGLFKTISSSETGKRLLLAVPKIVVAQDLNTVLTILSKEAEWNWGKFFGHIDNNIYKKMVMYQISGYILQAQVAMEDPANKDVLANIVPSLNKALASKNVPLLDTKQPAESISAIANMGIYIVTKKKINISPYVSSTFNAVHHAFKNKMRGIAFHEYTLEEKRMFITEALDEDIWLPLHKVWETLERLRAAKPACCSHLLCSVNRDGVISRKEEGQRLVMEGASLAAAWIIHQRQTDPKNMYTEDDKYMNIYRAVLAGAKGENCDQLFPSWEASCSLDSWRSRGHMEL